METETGMGAAAAAAPMYSGRTALATTAAAAAAAADASASESSDDDEFRPVMGETEMEAEGLVTGRGEQLAHAAAGVDGEMDEAQLRAEVVRLRASEAELREEVDVLDADCTKAETELAELKAKLAEASSAGGAEADVEELVLELEEVESELAQAKAELTKRDATIAALRSGTGDGSTAAGGDGKELERALEVGTRELEEVESELAQAKAELSQRDATIAALRGEASDGGRRSVISGEDGKELERTLEESESKRLLAEQRVEQQQVEIVDRDNQIAMLSVQLADASAKLEAMSQGQPEPPNENEVKLLRAALRDAEEAVRAKEADYAEQVELAAVATRELQERHRLLEQHLAETEQDLVDENSKLRELEDELHGCRSEMQNAALNGQAEMTALRAQLEKAKEAEMQNAVRSAQTEISALRAQLEKDKEEEMQNAARSAQTEISALRAQLQQAHEDTRAHARQAEEHQKRAEALEHDLSLAEARSATVGFSESEVTKARVAADVEIAKERDRAEQEELNARFSKAREQQLHADKLELLQRVDNLERHVSKLEGELMDSRKKERELRESSSPSHAASLAAVKASANVKARLEGVREWNAFMLSLLAEHESARATAVAVDQSNDMHLPQHAHYNRAGAHESLLKQLERSSGLTPLDNLGDEVRRFGSQNEDETETQNMVVNTQECSDSSMPQRLTQTKQPSEASRAAVGNALEAELQRVREAATAAMAAVNTHSDGKRQQLVEAKTVNLKLSPEPELSLSPEPEREHDPEPKPLPQLEPEPQPRQDALKVLASPGAAEARMVLGARIEQQREAAIAAKSRRLEQARMKRQAAKAAVRKFIVPSSQNGELSIDRSNVLVQRLQTMETKN